MRFCNWVFVFVLLSSVCSFSQEKYTEHVVSKGENITQIAAHYNIKASTIYELNPDAKKGIKFKSVLLIPSTTIKSKIVTTEKNTSFPEKTHAVLPKETIYGIAKQYGISVKDLYKSNPTVEKSGLRKGQKITIPGNEFNAGTQQLAIQEPITTAQKTPLKKEDVTDTTQLVSATETVEREIVAHETKYSIAKEYGITVSDLHKANPILETEALKIGQKITIPVKEESKLASVIVQNEIKKDSETVVQLGTENINTKAQVVTVKTDKVVSKTDAQTIIELAVSVVPVENEVVREVLAKETKYGIAKEYGITVKELEKQNPKIVTGLPVGYKLNIRSNKAVEAIVSTESPSSTFDSGNSESKYNVKSFHGTDFLDQLVSTASENIGTRYRTGGTTKDGFDCSGLMCTTFSNFDIQLPRTSIEQSQYGVKVDNEDAQKGDLIFFKTNGRRQINHVGMVVEAVDGDIKFIHASVSGGVMISSIKEKYYKKRVSQINRVL